MKRRLAAGLGLSLTFVLVSLARPANADAPLIQLFPIDSTATFYDCGFPVVQHLEGTARVIVRFDRSGEPTVATVFDSTTITLTNPLNQKMVSSKRAFFDRQEYDRDGSITYVTAGLVSHLILPGEGLVAANFGYTRFTLDADGNLLDVLVAGEHDGRLRTLVCPYLE